ncbi:hypothetical protein GOP47_0015887 [Adiantum capillus-veneris]|uniref:BAH domain-containing protein n=1 Tax=Adiantum capillus-veneris TaxID=13818 RepID=A0A9D4ULF2_ADICA|nr:hypothetical protein GOP47_0015887 [Adiantum capillus-veneris]
MCRLKWIGSPQKLNEGRTHYGCCLIESGVTVSIGDYVHMLPANPLHQLYLAKINDFFEIEEKMFVQVLWLYRQAELKHNPPCAPTENEVYHTNYYDCQLIQSIVGPCHVVQHTDCPIKPLTRKGQDISTDVYVCRYSYSEETGDFVEALLSDFDHKFCLIDKDHEEQAENDNPDTKDLTDILLQIERNMPLQTATALWPARRMAWLKKVKAVTCLEEAKEALIDLENEFNILLLEPSWKEQVHSCRSSDMLLGYIKSLSQNLQANAKILDNGQLETSSISKLTRCDSYRKEHKRKRATSALVNPHTSKKQASEESPLCRGIYKVEQGCLPLNAPSHLKNLRVALVRDIKKDCVTIAYPSMASLAECFGESNTVIEDGTQERKLTRCLFDQTSTSTCAKPRLDEEFRMTIETAQKALKYFISSPKYLEQGHLQSFWLRPGEYTNSRLSETHANKTDKCRSSKEILLSSLDQREQRTDDAHSLQSPDAYTLQKTIIGKTKDVSVDNNVGEIFESNIKLSEDESQKHMKNSLQKAIMVMPLDICDCEDSTFSDRIHDSRANCVSAQECSHEAQINGIAEQDHGIVRWGIRKKITYQKRCRGNAYSSDDVRNKLFPYEGSAPPKGQFKEPASFETDEKKHLALTCIMTNIGKGKMLKVPKEMQGRWSSERYKAAQLKLFQIMKDKGAVPGKPLLRPALREEARKHIGDTGLLDHLLKHMTDTVINNGERFRRRHNSEGAMEYWLEDARLQEMRKQAGVDPYWIPPPGWKFGDAIRTSKDEQFSETQLNELRLLREDVEKLKSQLHYVCLHLGTSFVESNGALVLGRDSGFQPWKKTESMTEQAQDRADGCQVELGCMEESVVVVQRNKGVPAQEDEQDAFTSKEVLQANAPEDKATKKNNASQQELCEIAKGSIEKTREEDEKNCGDELFLFYKAARPSLQMSPVKPSKTYRRRSAEKRSPGAYVLRRSPRSGVKEVGENKENVCPEKHRIDQLMKSGKSPRVSHRNALSAKSANVQLNSAVSSTQSKITLKQQTYHRLVPNAA